MTKSIWIVPVLLAGGLTSAAVGFAVLFMPISFHATSEIPLGDNLSLMSEIRAPGAALLVAGVFILAAVFVPRWRMAATWVSGALYLSYGTARLYSIAIDGMPHSTLVTAAVVELAIAAVCGLMIYRARAAA